MSATTSEYCPSLKELKKKLNLEMTEDIAYAQYTVNELLILELKKPSRIGHTKGYFNFLNKIMAFKTKNADVSILLYICLIHRKHP